MSVPRFWVEEGFAGLTGLGGLEVAVIAAAGVWRIVAIGVVACDVAGDTATKAIDSGGVDSPLHISDSGEVSPWTTLLSAVDSFCKKTLKWNENIYVACFHFLHNKKNLR